MSNEAEQKKLELSPEARSAMKATLTEPTTKEQVVRVSAKSQALPAADLRKEQGLTGGLLHLQRNYGNRYVERFLKSVGIQSKLSINQPGDV